MVTEREMNRMLCFGSDVMLDKHIVYHSILTEVVYGNKSHYLSIFKKELKFCCFSDSLCSQS